MGKIYLIRHGQTDSNSGRRFQGRIDTPLNASGVEQAVKMAEYLQDKKIDAIYSSSLLRAQSTAQALARVKNMPVMVREELQEISFGDWEGLSFDEIHDKWPQQIELFFSNPELCLPPNGEKFADVQQRARKLLDEILAEQGENKDIAIISHGGVIRTLIFSLLNIPLANFWKINIHNAAISTFSVWDGNFIAEGINDYHFLQEK